MTTLIRLLAPYAPVIVLAVCAVALGSAYTAQYGFDLEPCELCLWQRGPYAFAAVFALIALFAKEPSLKRIMVLLCSAMFLVEAGLAFHHVGVEQHWWKAFTACTGDIATGLSMEDLKAALMGKQPKACDEITWQIFGFSITVYNVLLGLALSVFCFFSAKQTEGNSEHG
jgi:disulfide bond formation protein DsbB